MYVQHFGMPGIAVLYYGPSQTKTYLSDNTFVSIVQDTNYPFDEGT